MKPELRHLIDGPHFHRAVMRQMVGLLPPDDAGLDSLLAEIIAADDIMAFMAVTSSTGKILVTGSKRSNENCQASPQILGFQFSAFQRF